MCNLLSAECMPGLSRHNDWGQIACGGNNGKCSRGIFSLSLELNSFQVHVGSSGGHFHSSADAIKKAL